MSPGNIFRRICFQFLSEILDKDHRISILPSFMVNVDLLMFCELPTASREVIDIIDIHERKELCLMHSETQPHRVWFVTRWSSIWQKNERQDTQQRGRRKKDGARVPIDTEAHTLHDLVINLCPMCTNSYLFLSTSSDTLMGQS